MRSEARLRIWGRMALVALGLPACRSSSARTHEAAHANPACTLVEHGFGPAGRVPVRADVVVAGLEVPWGIAFLSKDEWLVTERPGRIRLVRGSVLMSEPVATIAIADSSEGGLLGIALHPAFAQNALFYVYFTAAGAREAENRVERYKLAADHRTATRDRVIIEGIPSAKYHDGGRIRFGPDGMLYIGTGDARNPERAEDPASLSGKLLRLTPGGEIPKDNPWPGQAAFVIGVRNTEGFDWRDSSTLYLTDHGPSGELLRQGHDEVNIAHRGDNLGWPTIYSCGSQAGMVSPSLCWESAVPPGGAAIYRGRAIAEWKGSLLVGTLGSKHLHRIAFDAADPAKISAHEVYFEKEYGRLREVVMGPDEELYVTTSNCDGRGTCPQEKDKILRMTR